MACSRGCCATQAEHYRSISFSAGPTAPTLKERRWAKDHDAYRALRRQGIQPRCIDGSHRMAQVASSQTEIELGRTMPKAERQIFEEVSSGFEN